MTSLKQQLARLQEENARLREQLAELPRLQAIKEEYERSRLFYAVLDKMTRLALDCPDIDEFYAQVHEATGQLMNARNFYIVLIDPVTECLRFVYH